LSALKLSASGIVDSKSDSKAESAAAAAGTPSELAHNYRVETLKTVYARLIADKLTGMTEAQFLASPPVQTLLNRQQTTIEVFQNRLVAGIV
jgi:hypothetical protein